MTSEIEVIEAEVSDGGDRDQWDIYTLKVRGRLVVIEHFGGEDFVTIKDGIGGRRDICQSDFIACAEAIATYENDDVARVVKYYTSLGRR